MKNVAENNTYGQSNHEAPTNDVVNLRYNRHRDCNYNGLRNEVFNGLHTNKADNEILNVDDKNASDERGNSEVY